MIHIYLYLTKTKDNKHIKELIGAAYENDNAKPYATLKLTSALSNGKPDRTDYYKKYNVFGIKPDNFYEELQYWLEELNATLESDSQGVLIDPSTVVYTNDYKALEDILWIAPDVIEVDVKACKKKCTCSSI